MIGMMFAATLGIYRVYGNQTQDTPAIGGGIYRTYEFFATTTAGAVAIATSTNATSSNITAAPDANGIWNTGVMDIRGAKRVTVYFTRGSAFSTANSGTSTFAIQVSPDGTNWYYENKLVVSTSSPAGTSLSGTMPLWGPFVTIGAANASGIVGTTTLHYSLDLTSETYQAMRCIVQTATDGSGSCFASASF